VLAAGSTRCLPHRPGELARRWVAGRPAGHGPGPGKARACRIALAVSRGRPGTGEAAGSLARETAIVGSGAVPRSLVWREPGAGRAWSWRPLRLLERVLAHRMLAVRRLLRRRAAGERALRWRRVLVAGRLVAGRLGAARLGVAVPRSGGSARGHARLRPAVAGPAVTRAGGTRCSVRAGRAAPGSSGEASSLWERRPGEPWSGLPAGTRSAVRLTSVPARASAVVRPGAGVGLWLPAPTP
jgi:hypothetical protein